MLGNLLDNASKWARSQREPRRPRPMLARPATAPAATGSRSASTTTAPASPREQIARAHRARPAARRDQARLRPRPFHRRRPRLLLQRQVRAQPAPTSAASPPASPCRSRTSSPHVHFDTDDALRMLAGATRGRSGFTPPAASKPPSHVRHPMCTNRRREPYFRPNRGNTRGLRLTLRPRCRHRRSHGEVS